MGVCGLMFAFWLASLRLIKVMLWGCVVTVVSCELVVMLSDCVGFDLVVSFGW